MSETTVCQIRDVEKNFYDIFVFSSSDFLAGNEDVRYHPAGRELVTELTMQTNMRYHDVYRGWNDENGGGKTVYQYDLGLETAFPVVLLNNDCRIDAGFQRQTFSSDYSSEHKEIEFSGNNFQTYSFDGAFLFDGVRDKIGVRVNYAAGRNRENLKINQYPSDTADALLEEYFYSLLEPAFGSMVDFDITGRAVNYALEYRRIVSASLTLGLNFYQEIDGENAGIEYYSSVEKIAGWKNLSGLFRLNRCSGGLTCEYTMNNFVFRSSAAFSAPSYTLTIDQNGSVQGGGVNLEILKLADANCTGTGASFGAGVSCAIGSGMSAGLGYTYIRNTYTGQVYASTPVLGFEIIPIAHQLNVNFDDKMNNNLFSFTWKHAVSSLWNYSLSIEYLSSNNDVAYDSKVSTEFGIGGTKEESGDYIVVDLYKIDVQTSVNISKTTGLKFFCTQYVPVVKTSTHENNGAEHTPISGTVNNQRSRGGTIYGLSVFYNFN